MKTAAPELKRILTTAVGLVFLVAAIVVSTPTLASAVTAWSGFITADSTYTFSTLTGDHTIEESDVITVRFRNGTATASGASSVIETITSSPDCSRTSTTTAVLNASDYPYDIAGSLPELGVAGSYNVYLPPVSAPSTTSTIDTCGTSSEFDSSFAVGSQQTVVDTGASAPAGWTSLSGSASATAPVEPIGFHRTSYSWSLTPSDVERDTDGDGIPDSEDPDDDNDGVLDVDDAFPLDDQESVDTDGDGVGNNADADDDADGVPDFFDAFPLDGTETTDTDGDGIGDNADPEDCRVESFDWDAGLRFSVEPEILNLGISVPWCNDGTSSRLANSPTVYGDAPAGPTSTVLELVGMEFRYAGETERFSAVRDLAGVTTVTAKPRFEVCEDFSALIGLVPGGPSLGKGLFNFLPRKAKLKIIDAWEQATIGFVIRLTPTGTLYTKEFRTWLLEAIDELFDEAVGALVSGEFTTVCIDTWTPTITVELHPDGTSDAAVTSDLGALEVWEAHPQF